MNRRVGEGQHSVRVAHAFSDPCILTTPEGVKMIAESIADYLESNSNVVK